MNTEIKETVHGTWLVNGVEVYEDSEGKYVAKGLILENEIKDFLAYIKKNASTNRLFGLESLKKELQKVDDTISKLKIQLYILNSGKNLFSREKITLLNYYHKQLNKYHEMRNEIINNLPVTFKTVTVNRPRKAIHKK